MQTVAANSAGSIISFTNQKKKQKKNSTEKSYLISLVPKALLLCSDEKVNCCPHETIYYQIVALFSGSPPMQQRKSMQVVAYMWLTLSSYEPLNYSYTTD